jgi:6-phosphogluconolactonase
VLDYGAMKNLRRLCSLFILQSAPLALLDVSGKVMPPPAESYRAYVGTYTAKTNSRGIYEFDFDAATGKMSAVQVAAETKDPSWIIVHPNGNFLYAANEMGKASTVSAFAIEPKSGKLTQLNQLHALGEDPCYLSFDRTGKFLFVANYTSGSVAVFPILPDGKLGEHTALQQDSGSLGPNKERQEAPHAHFITPSEHNRFVYVADLGLDRVLIYKFDSTKGTLAQAPENSWATLKPGTGPRHVAFSKDGKFMYVVGEMTSTVTVFANEGQETFRTIQTAAMLPAGFSGRNDAAEIEIHPNGKFLYASNRGHDSIVVYAIDRKTGMVQQMADIPTGGKEPRHFAIDPTGNFLFAENQLSDTIVEFRIDGASGKLTPTGDTLSVPAPVCITFLSVH